MTPFLYSIRVFSFFYRFPPSSQHPAAVFLFFIFTVFLYLFHICALCQIFAKLYVLTSFCSLSSCLSYHTVITFCTHTFPSPHSNIPFPCTVFYVLRKFVFIFSSANLSIFSDNFIKFSLPFLLLNTFHPLPSYCPSSPSLWLSFV